MNKLSSLSIFFPAFNEEKNIGKCIEEAIEIGSRIATKLEVIVINDGSKDNTEGVVKKYIRKYKNVRLVNHPFNMGYGSALRSGFYEAKFDYIAYMDSDRQFDFADIKKLANKIENYDLVVGYRINRADKFIRVLNGKLWNLLVSILLNLRIKDIDCGFKLIKKRVIDVIPKLESTGATISAEMLVKAKKKGFQITQVGLLHKPRQFGSATGGNPLHIFRAFRDLLLLLPKI